MARASKDSRAGELINARYELRELIASGAVSDAYRADDRRQPKSVKLTLLRPEFALQAGVVQRFLHAGKLLSALHHTNVAHVIAIETDDTGIPFVVEEIVEGDALSKTFSESSSGMALDAALTLVMPVIEALCALHARGLWHGQLDSEHVVMAQVGGRSLPKLVGFSGIAKAQPRPGARNRVAPEQRDGKNAGDARADVWAIGALLHEALCGVPPSDDAGLLQRRAPHLSREVVALIQSCLAREPAQRPSRVEDVRVALTGGGDRVRTGRVSAEPVAPRSSVISKPPEPTKAAPTKPAETKPAETRPVETNLAQTRPEAGLDFALGATMMQQPAPRVQPAPSAEPAAFAMDATREARAVSKRPSGKPAKSASGAAAKGSGPGMHPPPLPEPPKANVKNLEDIAAAFGPIEGAERIGQSESADASRAREFRNSLDAQAEAEAKKRPRRRDDSGQHATLPARNDKRDDKRGAPSGLLLSRKQLREGTGPQPRAMTQEEMRQVRERLLAAEPRRWRAFGDGLLLAFSVALIWFMPLLSDASHSRAQAALGASAPRVLAAFVVVAIVTLVRTWAVNAQLKPMMLGQATFALQIVVVCLSVLCAGFFFPNGALGAAESVARWTMPWAASGFYLFMGMYGVMRGVRDSTNNLVTGALVAVLYSGGFYGSYRALADGVLHRGNGGGTASSGAFGFGRAKKASDLLHKVAAGEIRAADAGVRVEERKEIGASEEDDMRAVDQLRKRDPKLEQLQQRVKDVAPPE